MTSKDRQLEADGAAVASNGEVVDVLGRRRMDREHDVRSRSQGRTSTGGAGLVAVSRMLRRRLGLVLLCLVLVPVAALAFSLTQDELYSASSSLLFRDPGFDESLFGGQAFAGSQDSSREAATNERLVGLPEVSDRTAKAIGKGLSGLQVSDSIEVAAVGESDIVRITATHPDPALAAQIANTQAEQYIVFRRETDRGKIREAQRLLERRLKTLGPAEQQSDRGRSLQNQVEDLAGLAAVQTGNADQVQTATVPTAPVSPKPLRNTGLGALLGLMLGVGLAFLAEQLDRRLKEPEDVEEAFGLPILGTVPQSRAIERAGAQGQTGGEPEAEAFRRLRTNLRYFNVDRQIRSVLVTSAAPGEGKTTVSWNLALAAARTGEQVLYLEADLRRPSLSRYLEPSQHGLSSVLAGVAHFDDVLFSVPVGEFQSGDETSGPLVDVISSGPIPPNPAELIESDRMRRLLSQVEELYDLVVIDTPPTSLVADAIPVIAQVNGVIVVSQLGRSDRDDAESLREQLQNLNAPVLGVVLNGHTAKSLYYGY